MKMLRLAAVLCAGLACSAAFAAAASAPAFQQGNPGIKSIGPLAFAPDGVLLAGDTRSGAIFAIATGDTARGDATKNLAVAGIDQKVAALFGKTAADIVITDIAVNPTSRQAYLAVHIGRSADIVPMLVRVKLDGTLENVALDNVRYSKVEFTNVPADNPAARRNPRAESITDIGYVDGKVFVAGLSTEEFASTLRMVNYPFTSTVASTGVEIFHGAHGRFETNSPIRTFTSVTLDNKSRLIASYTCTPLVDIALNQLAPGAKVRGKTVAELGNGNTPLDMIVYQKDGKNFLLMANTSRGVMKVGIDNMDKTETITSQVDLKHDNMTFDTIANWTGIVQMDRLDNNHAVVLAQAGTSVNLESRMLP